MHTPKQKQHPIAPALIKHVALLMAGLAPAASGAEIVKSNNGDGLSSTSSWVGGVLPTAQDVVVFDNSLDANLFINMDASLSLLGVKGVGYNTGITVDTFGSGLGAAAVLTLGSAGLDFSGAISGTSFTFDSPSIQLARGVRGNWSVADGATVTLRGTLSPNGGAVNFNLTAANSGVFSGLGFSQAASKILPFPATVTKADGAITFAALDGSKNVIPGDTVAGIVANPTETTAGTAVALASFPDGAYVDVTVSNANAANTAFNVAATQNTTSGSSTGVRFAQPHATTGTNWTVGFGNSGRFQSSNPLHILVTPGVGARDVIFGNGGGAHEFRFNNGAAQLIFEQFNTLGNLYWRGDVSAASSASTGSAIIKTGPGKVIWANPSFFAYASTYVSITDGVFQMGENNATGSLHFINATNNIVPVITNGGTLRLQRSDAFTFPNVLAGSGGLEIAMSGVGNANVTGINTYTGTTKLESGTLTLGSASALGASSLINLAGGTLAYGAGITTDISASAVTLSGNSAVNTGGNNVTWANSVGGAGAGALTKTGTGVLTLAGANTYTGGTTVNGGELVLANVSGSATGTGAVSLTSGAILRGTGSAAGTVTAGLGSKIAPGIAGVGTLTAAGLTLGSGSLLDLEFTSISSNDKMVVTGPNSLTINGGGLTLLDASNASAWKTPGTYNLLQFNGSVQGTGAGALSVLNPQAGYAYTFGTSGNFVTLEIELDAILSQWTSTGAGSWGSASSWGNGVPTSGYTAQFTTDLAAPATVTLDGNRTVNGMVFSSTNAYTIAQGTGGTLTLDKGAKNVAVNVTLGDHVISAPISLVSTLAASTNANTSLTLSGVVSGAGGLIKTGPGTLNLNGNNTFSGAINASGGTIAFALPTSLGTGAVSLNGATLKYGVGNNADISNSAITFAQDGATIDTNGNDVIWSNVVGNGGTGGLTKTGAGILSLGAANNYSGNTTVKAGVLQIDTNNRLGAAASTLVFDGGTLAASGTFSLDTVGETTVQRPIQVEAAGGTINVAANATLTVNSVLNGTGVLAKAGEGTLTLTSTSSDASKSGGFTLRNGTLNLGTDISFGNGLTGFIGAGTLTLEGGTLTTVNTPNNTLGIGNAIDVPSGKTAGIITPNRFALTGAVSGAGTLNMSINTNVTRADFSNNWSAFTGTLNLTGTGGIRLLNNGGGFNVAGLAGAHLNAASANLTLIAATNTAGNVFQIGALSGNATLSNSNGGASNYQIGARNESTVFSGNFIPGNSHNQLTKVGTGTLTLNGATLQNGLTAVNGGTLLIDSVLPASVAPEPTLPARFVTVAAAGTLGGSGTITPATVVNGGLRPDPTGKRGGQLTFEGVLELASTAVTQFDMDGASFTGVKANAASAVTFGGAVKFNFLGTVFSGTYQAFEIASTPTGAFAGVSVTTTTATESPLTDSGSGIWSGTVGAQSYSFNVGTGVLTVTGGATAVTPGASVLSATAGNAKIDLSWTSASGADTYTVKRALVSGGPYTNLISNLAGTTYSDTTVTNDTTYYYVVQAKNSTSNLSGVVSNEVSATPVAGPAHTALQTWRFEQFGVYDDTGAVLAGDTEDFDGDGLANLLEYALGTNPTVANASPVTVTKSGNFLTLTYPRNSVADAGLTYTVQGSNDLTGGFTAGGGTTNTVGSTSTYTDNVSVSTAGVRRFLRLSVSYTAP